jgi:hypothetical protein
MEELRDIAQFRSARFSPVLPDDSQVNPGVYGAELAFWLCSELASLGVVTSYPVSEDWGWFIEYTAAGGAEFAVHCGNVQGETNLWLLSLRRFGRKFLGRDKPPYSQADPLVAGIQTLLRGEPSISQLEWLYSEHAA